MHRHELLGLHLPVYGGQLTLQHRRVRSWAVVFYIFPVCALLMQLHATCSKQMLGLAPRSKPQAAIPRIPVMCYHNTKECTGRLVRRPSSLYAI